MKGAIYVLAERTVPMKRIDARWLLSYLHYDQSVYPPAEEAEEGRQAGDAYDEPGRTRVVGIEIKPFLPKRKRRGRR
jgi:hypothetical protein